MPDAPSFEKVMVTGGSGFLGQHLVRALVETGARPTLLTRTLNQHGSLDGVQNSVRRVQLDLLDHERVREFLLEEKPATLFHLAGTRRCDDGTSACVSCAKLNVGATVQLLDAARRAGVRRVVIMGSADEYGDQQGPLHEGLHARPVSAYAVSKYAATSFAQAMHASEGCPVVVLRPFSVYGPHQPAFMFVAEAIKCAVTGMPFRMSEGTQQRDLVFVEDVVRALLAVARAPEVEGRVINIGSGQPRRLRDVAALIWQLSESRAPLLVGARPAPVDETHDTWADIRLAREILNWEPRVNLENGLRATIQWAREQFEQRNSAHIKG
jgi:nucleoside-diphosphate-sugar epimerase